MLIIKELFIVQLESRKPSSYLFKHCLCCMLSPPAEYSKCEDGKKLKLYQNDNKSANLPSIILSANLLTCRIYK